MLLPESNPYVSGEISIPETLVRTGEERASVTLPLQLHMFLVGCLAEHLHDPDIAHHVLALGLLRSATISGESGNVLLKRTGDAALLLAGFFPERASRLHVGPRYFRDMGQAAYASLAVKLQAVGKADRGKFYDEVVERFQLLENVLDAARVRPGGDEESFRWFLTSIQ